MAEAADPDAPGGEPVGGPITTPDGRYLVVHGRLWRASSPLLGQEERDALVSELMAARRAKKAALGGEDRAAVTAARDRVDAVKRRLGERGPVWWTDGQPDLNRKLVRNTPYAEWYAEQEDLSR